MLPLGNHQRQRDAQLHRRFLWAMASTLTILCYGICLFNGEHSTRRRIWQCTNKDPFCKKWNDPTWIKCLECKHPRPTTATVPPPSEIITPTGRPDTCTFNTSRKYKDGKIQHDFVKSTIELERNKSKTLQILKEIEKIPLPKSMKSEVRKEKARKRKKKWQKNKDTKKHIRVTHKRKPKATAHLHRLIAGETRLKLIKDAKGHKAGEFAKFVGFDSGFKKGGYSVIWEDENLSDSDFSWSDTVKLKAKRKGGKRRTKTYTGKEKEKRDRNMVRKIFKIVA